jgi:SNF2 family DNA or RNA helicase
LDILSPATGLTGWGAVPPVRNTQFSLKGSMNIVNDTALRFHCSHDVAKQITTYIDKSELIGAEGGHSEVLMYWGINEVQKLVRLLPDSNKIPSPIERDYQWPGMFTPFDHQRDTARFLTLHRRAFCFNEAGTGKTSAAIWAADYLMNHGLVKRVLVVCPLSIMQSAWQADLFKTVMHRTCGVAHGSKRKKVINGGYEFVIINYDGVNAERETIMDGGFDLIIVDEANAYKNPSTVRWKNLAKIIRPDTYLWMMTGTPASQSPEDAFGLAKLVNPNNIPKYKTAWKDAVMQQITRFKWIPKPHAKGLVFNALQPAIRYEKAQCLDLPDLMYQTREVPLSAQATSYYKELRKEMQIEAAGETISTVNAAAALTKLLQLSGGAVYTDDHNVIEFDVSPRLNVLGEVIDEASHKVIVFIPYRHTIKVVQDYLTKNNITTEIISGDVTASNRAAIFNKFQTTDTPRVLLIQPQAASHGVTLTAADTIVFWSPVMSVETYLQCVARIDRVGQKNKMTVIHLQGSEVEKRMYTMLQGKVDMHTQLVDLYKEEIGESV